jgi:polyphosphate kinase
MGSKLSKSDYLKQLEPLELELNAVANWLQVTGKRLLVVIEGRDTAGKGGVISAISDTLNPRQSHVAPRSGTFSGTWRTCLQQVKSC